MNHNIHSNRLIHETSPYLLQHAGNPVDWYPWGEEALQRARDENKPILLSIGYSACHWCHVMEHESFEDEAVAAIMNELFVCIKVDREERPDLDKIYQIAHQMLTQRPGGWPLNMFLTPDDHTPFFGGTYFPPQPRYGMPAFPDLLKRVDGYFREHRADIDSQNAAVHEAFGRIQAHAATPGVKIDPAPLAGARNELGAHFDARFGGFGQAPKFPHPTSLTRLLRHSALRRRQGEADDQALHMTRYTLHAMAGGGLYDQVGGGFCRYSVDDRWMIPHFEKMLYDNGPLLALYSDAHAACGDARFAEVARETGDWVRREMQSPDGGYYSTLDADSEGHEGKYYVWTPDEVRALLDEREYKVTAALFGLDRAANFEKHWWHLHRYNSDAEVAGQLGISEAGVASAWAGARAKLFAARERRVRPARDDKILTAWNGLMITGMARAGRRLNEPRFIASAERALDFVRARLWRDGRLLATAKDDKAHLNAYLDDYAFLIEGVLELLQARWRDGDLDFAVELAEVLLDHYEDKAQGGFYFTADDHERLMARLKPAADDALPAGNGVAALVLQRLGHLVGAQHFLTAAERTIEAMWSEIARYPSAHNALLDAVEEYFNPTETVVLRGQPAAMLPWLDELAREYAPARLLLAIPTDAGPLPGVLAERHARDAVTAYVCQGHQCLAPVASLDALKEQLTGAAAATPV